MLVEGFAVRDKRTSFHAKNNKCLTNKEACIGAGVGGGRETTQEPLHMEIF